jgi:hypothetical protein
MIFSAQDIRELVEHEASPGSHVLSVYLNVDQAQASNLNRGFEAALRGLLRSIEEGVTDKDERKQLALAIEKTMRAVARLKPHGRGFVCFCDLSKDLFWQREVQVGFANHVRWSAKPYTRPMLEAFDEFRRVALILTDKGQARLFTVSLNEIQEHVDALAQGGVKHIKGPGSDHMRSQRQVQRKAEGHVLQHLKHVAGLVDELAEQRQFDHLILAGPVEATSELQHLLTDRLRRRVVGSLTLPMNADVHQIQEAVRQLECEVARASEEHLVNDLLTAAAKNRHAVVGLDQTLRSLQEGRIWRLVYADGFVTEGGECARCGLLHSSDFEACLDCQGPIQPAKDLVASAASRVVSSGGKVDQVRANAAHVLRQAGGVGAFLRY